MCDRPGLFKSLNRYIALNTRSHSHIGLALIDIKNFTSVNRVFNFHHGDMVLFYLQQRLVELASQSDCVFRLGSDEFALIIPRLESGAQIVLEANNILDNVRNPYRWNDQEFSFDVNLGCIALPAEQVKPEQLLSSAEHLLQRAKKENRSVCYATQVQHQNDDYVWLLEQDLLQALHHNELELYFQPKIELSTGKPVHAEALLRWHHPEKGLISTGFIIEMISRLNREFELTKWALHTALRQMKMWPTFWGSNGVAVNVPANLVHHPEFRQLVEDSLHIWQAEPEQLTVEITENAIIEDKQAGFNNLAYLKTSGIHISIDDFGTGYSSLEYFKSIPATELKIDQSFVINMAENSGDSNIAQLIIDLAHRFNLKVVAEGVENKEVLKKLSRLDCDYVQGYFIAEPMAADDYMQWLNNYQPVPIAG